MGPIKKREHTSKLEPPDKLLSGSTLPKISFREEITQPAMRFYGNKSIMMSFHGLPL